MKVYALLVSHFSSVSKVCAHGDRMLRHRRAVPPLHIFEHETARKAVLQCVSITNGVPRQVSPLFAFSSFFLGSTKDCFRALAN